MALTESNMLSLGTKAPDFLLLDTVTDNFVTFPIVKGQFGTVVMFICNHCPYVIYLNNDIVALANTYKSKGIGFVAISSNDAEKYPADAPDKMKIQAEQEAYPFPYLYDETQMVAKAYDAACTPDFYVFDKNDILVYRGRFDGSRPSNDIPITGADLKESLERLLLGTEQVKAQYPSAGCNIKWK
ncbi:MAG: thioredoxin family protein [Saprospiraceae bacterium]|nr:thioredoxin family protein [Saprospiraceae bacterium]